MKTMQRVAVGLGWLFAVGQASAVFSNGDFSDGLTGWTFDNDVFVADGHAVLQDPGTGYSVLYQGAALGVDFFRIDFDFQNVLSDNVLPGFFLDVFFASIYYIDDLAQFDLGSGGYDASAGLFDMDSTGAYNVNGSIGASPLGPEWLHYSGSLPNSYSNIVTVFEIHNLNGAGGDSLVRLDNVTVVVPEPGSGLLCAVGLLLGGGIRLVRSRRQGAV